MVVVPGLVCVRTRVSYLLDIRQPSPCGYSEKTMPSLGEGKCKCLGLCQWVDVKCRFLCFHQAAEVQDQYQEKDIKECEVK